MADSANQFNPDYAVSPGLVLQERLEVMGISQAEFARRCGCAPKLISEIIAGKTPVDTETAIQFERVTGLHSSIWMGIEADYQLYLAKQEESEKTKNWLPWAKKFPIKELSQRGNIKKPDSPSDTLNTVLAFFGVESVNAWEDKYRTTPVYYRHSPSFDSQSPALAAWLRLGEIEAEQSDLPDYNEATFLESLRQIRSLTSTMTDQTFTEVQSLCHRSGVVLCFTKPFSGVRLSGASHWLSPQKPVIQLSARHKTDDHLWFSLFHEAAHILLHKEKEGIFVHGIRGKAADTQSDESTAESEADIWAENFLVPRADWDRFASSFRGSDPEVREFAQRQGIAPGIIVGRLQREGWLPWSHLNRLKRKLGWVTPPSQAL